jgi:hypothetical protein
LIKSGELEFQAIADLDDLGAKTGTSVKARWTAPSLMPYLLPWLFLLALLLPRKNRSASVIWILVPLVITLLFSKALGLFGTSLCDMLGMFLYGIAFALAAFWLLMPWLRRRFWIATFFLMTLLIWGVSAGSGLIGSDWEDGTMVAYAITMGVYAAIISLALTIAGRLSQKRFKFIRFMLALVLVITICVGGIFLVPFFQNPSGIMEVLLGLAIAIGLMIGMILPYLLLSAIVGFYVRRLEEFIQPASEKPPVIQANLPK